MDLHGRRVRRVRRDQGDPEHPHHDHEQRGGDAQGGGQGGRATARRADARQVRARALERLRHRAAPPGRSQGRGGCLREGHGDGAGLRRRLGQRRPGAHPGRQHGGRGRDPAPGAGERPRAGQDALLPRHRAQGAWPIRRGARPPAHRRRALPAGPRGPQPDRPRALPEAPVQGGHHGTAEGARDRPRRPAGALQPDALLAGARRGRQGPAGAGAVRALQGGRERAGHHRALSAAPSQRQQRAPGHPRAPHGGALAGTARPRLQRSGTVRRTRLSALALFAMGALALPRAFEAPVRSASPSPASASAVSFSDATAAAGIRFKHNSGAFGKKYLPETMGSGVLFVDLDGDGWPDLFFVNSKSWPGRPGPPTLPALYRNNRDGTFTDVTRGSGLDVSMYGLGAAAADYDNDGRVDIYVTGLGGNRLFHNEGNGRFSDVTARAGVSGGGFGTSAAFFDYDKDGKLDLFVANYVQWSLDKDLFCTLDGTRKSYCTPESYKGQSPILYRNRGDGTFEDVTVKAGLSDPNSKALGVAVLDYDDDGWPDLFVANDTQPNKLYRNGGKGTFTDVGMAAGVAFSESGVARAGMGTDAA